MRGNNFNYYHPVRLRFGPGQLDGLSEAVSSWGCRPLLVTGRWGGAKVSLHECCRKLLSDGGMDVTVFSGVSPNPSTDQVRAASEKGREGNCDVVVGVGGGSPMDVAKAAALEMTHPEPCFHYAYFHPRQPTAATLPIVLVPTTSGSGSHMSRCSVITDAATANKTGVISDFLFAREAVVDPNLMVTVPPEVTAESGFDVFAHAFECFININATPMGDLLALEAIRIVAESLPRAVREGGDLESRTLMAWADTLAGMCIANIGTTLPHAMGQPISGHFPTVSHGLALAMIFPQVMEFTWEASLSKFAAVARLMDLELRSVSEEEAARGSVVALQGFLNRIGIQRKLRQFGISRSDLPVLIEETLRYPDVRMNPVVPSREQLELMFERSL